MRHGPLNRIVTTVATIVLAAPLAEADDAFVKRASSAIAVTADGGLLLVVNPDSGSLSVVDTGELAVLAEIAVGEDPRTVAVADDGRRAYVANRGSGTLSLVDLAALETAAELEVGRRPYGVTVAPDGRRVYVAVQDEDRVAVVDALRLQVETSIEVADRPAGLAIAEDGAALYVTHLLAGMVTVVDLEAGYPVTELALWPDSNLVQSIVPSPDGRIGFVPHTRSNTENRALTFDTTVFPLVSRVDLESRQHLVGQHISLDTVDPPGVGLPFDAAPSPEGSILYVLNAASNDVTVVDLGTGLRRAHVEVGDNPRGIVLSPDGSRAFVNNTLSGTVSVIDTDTHLVSATLPVTTIPLPPALLVGKRLFNSSDDPRLAQAQWIACSSCHFDGEHDGRTWLFNFAGPRNTTTLHGMVQSYPLRWSAEWDESADSEFAITSEQFGSGLLDGGMHEPLAEPNTGRSYELDSLAAFIDSLEMPANGLRASLDPASVERGRALFFDVVVGCGDCHPRPYFTDYAVHDVGTADGPDERIGPEIDTPTLRDLGRSAPYLHVGSAATLLDVLTTANPDDLHGVTSHLSSGELRDLEAFMLAIPAANHACVGCADDQLKHHRAGGCVASHGDSPKLDLAPPRRPRGRVVDREMVAGRVVSGSSGAPVPGALVTIRATEYRTTTAADGGFTIALPAGLGEVEVTAWAPGHYVASLMAEPPASGLELNLRRHHSVDHADYEWVDPTPDPDSDSACGNCHPMILPQWSGNAHGGAISNPRFYSFYNGTDLTGSHAVAPGYLLDFPGTTGNCAACHAPGAAVDAPFTTDMNAVRDSLTSGIHCDFCHKVGGAWLKTESRRSLDCTPCHKLGDGRLEGSIERTYPNSPGVFALRTLRPPAGDQIFFGPFPDIHDPDAYLPLMHESGFCAPCHQFSFWGTPIYTSYDEWLASPYADPDSGQTCQDCHMPPTGDEFYALPEVGGLPHPPETIPSHLQLGATDEGLLQSTVDLEVVAEVVEGAIELTVTLTNTGAGHHAPTDHPGRHMLLVVEARAADGAPLVQLDGPAVPDWGGDLAGEPGAGYAKLLQDVATGEWPVVSYWKQAVILDDSRLPALASATTRYRFEPPASGDVDITVRLVFRRLFQEIAERYGWQLGEVVMEQRSLTVGAR